MTKAAAQAGLTGRDPVVGTSAIAADAGQ